MTQFTDLQTFYEYVQQHALDHARAGEIARLAQRLRDYAHERAEEDMERKAQWEVDLFNFRIEDGQAGPLWRGVDEGGNEVPYPDLDSYGDDALDYVQERLGGATNPLVVARCATVLWSSRRKHHRFGHAAVNALLELARAFEARDQTLPDGHYGLRVLDCIRNAWALSRQTKHRVEDVAAEMRRLILEFSYESSSSFALRLNLIELMLDGRRWISDQHFAGFVDVCWRVSGSLVSSDNIHGAISMLAAGAKVDRRLGATTHDWQRRRAELYETLMARAREQGNLASMDFCQTALQIYRELRDETKVRELEHAYSGIREEMRLGEIATEVNVTEQVKHAREAAARLVEQGSEAIIGAIMGATGMLPCVDDVEVMAQESARRYPASSLFPTVVLDERGHPAQHFWTEADKKRHSVLQIYDWLMWFDRVYLINEIFLQATQSDRLSAEIVVGYLRDNSWLGTELERPMPHGQVERYTWLDLIHGSLEQYFQETCRVGQEPQARPDVVRALDSLVLKIEGMVRDLCRLRGAQTTYHTQDRQGGRIAREKDLNMLLREEVLEDLIGKDDLFFLKYLLVEKAGLNLRHRVAHGLMSFRNYRIELMHLVLVAMLRLAKYQITGAADHVPRGQEQDA